MGLVSLKQEFNYLTDLEATASNARYFLSQIRLSISGYDFRTIKSWSKLVVTIKEYLESIKQPEPEDIDTDSEVEAEIIKKYKTTSLTWRLVKSIENINSTKDYKSIRRRLSLWLHPDRNKDKLSTKYMSIFNNIFDIIKNKVS